MAFCLSGPGLNPGGALGLESLLFCFFNLSFCACGIFLRDRSDITKISIQKLPWRFTPSRPGFESLRRLACEWWQPNRLVIFRRSCSRKSFKKLNAWTFAQEPLSNGEVIWLWVQVPFVVKCSPSNLWLITPVPIVTLRCLKYGFSEMETDTLGS